MNYQNLFSIAILHNYFSDATDFVPEADQYVNLSPTPECQELIKQYRLKSRYTPGRLHLISPVREGASSTFLPQASVTFSFFLKVNNPVFHHFTDLQSLAGITYPRFFVDGANTALSVEAYQQDATDTFVIPQSRDAQSSFFLNNKPVSESFTVTGLTPTPTPAYDADLNKLSFDTTPVGYTNGQKFQVAYPIVPRWQANVLGIVDITLDGTSLAFDKNFTISFTRKEQHWDYYIVAPDTLLAANLSIIGPETFGTAVEKVDGDVYDRLKKTFPDAKVFNITSANPVPYKKQVVQGIKLQQDSETIINNLPNPAPENEGVGILNIYS